MTHEQALAVERFQIWINLWRTTIADDLATLGVGPEVLASLYTTLACTIDLVAVLTSPLPDAPPVTLAA